MQETPMGALPLCEQPISTELLLLTTASIQPSILPPQPNRVHRRMSHNDAYYINYVSLLIRMHFVVGHPWGIA